MNNEERFLSLLTYHQEAITGLTEVCNLLNQRVKLLEEIINAQVQSVEVKL